MKNLYENITNQIIDLMETHGTDWTKPWTARGTGLDYNVVSNKAYRGINVFLLGMAGYETPVWGTFKQWKSKGASVRKGEKGTIGVFYKQVSVKDRDTDEDKIIPVLKHFYLFNADQVDGYEAEKLTPVNSAQKVKNGEKFIRDCKAKITHGGNRACYIPSTDEIRLPPFSAFNESEGYYSTAFHELSHWSGAKHRLNRDLRGSFGSQSYAMEELVAELSAAFICCQTGISAQPRVDHAKYLNGWLSVLKNDKRAFMRSASKAQAAADYLNELQSKSEAA